MSHNITVQGGTSVRLPTAGKYCDRDIVITAQGGSEDLNEVLTEQEALIAELQDTLKGKASGGGSSTPAAMALIRRGVGFIDTGINGANSNLTIKVRYELLSLPTGYWTLIRAYLNESTDSTRIIFNKETITYCCLNSIPTSSLYSSQKRYAGVVYTDVLTPASGTNFTYTTNGASVTKARVSGNPLVGENLTLFLDSASTDSVTAKVYYLKIYDGDTLVRDYVPHIDPSGECGMYDKITQQFYGNDGVGTFEVETVGVIE